MILHEDMKAHRKDCPYEVIQCEYHSVGGDVRMPRKRQGEHDEENMEKHLQLNYVTSAKDELASSKSELEFRVNN